MLQEALEIQKGLSSETRIEAIQELQTKYETEKKESQIRELSQESKIQNLKLRQQRFGLIGLGSISFFLIGGGALLVRQRQLKEARKLTEIELEETKRRLELERQYRSSELKAIRSQMNPHFVFNALNSIQEYIIMNEKKLAGKYLGKFADLMRIYLNHSQVKEVTIDDELIAMNLYLELEKLRFEDTLDYSVSIDHDVDSMFTIPSLLAQPYVENSIKHGLFHKKKWIEI